MFNKPSPRPPSARRFHQLAREIRRGCVDDWELFNLCDSNPFYKAQLLALLNEPAKQAKLAKQEQEEASRRAYLEHKGKVKRTCLQRRSYLSDRERLHRNTYPEFIQQLKEDSERRKQEKIQQEKDQKKWMRFVISIYEYRSNQAGSWCSHSDLPEVTQLIWSTSPYELVSTWPEHSQCPIDPQPCVPENHATIFSTEGTAQARERDAANYLQAIGAWMRENNMNLKL